MKTKIKHIYHLCYRTVSACLVVAVMLAATHAKDVIAQPVILAGKSQGDAQMAARTPDDPAQKSMSDLHNHTDKTMLKNFAKSMGDTSSLAARRDERDEPSDDRTLSRRLFEVYMMIQFAYASATH